MFREIQESFHQLDDETQKAEMGRYTAHHQLKLLDYIYDHFDVFRLLLDGAHGTRFACFLDELVDIEVEYTYQYMEVIGCESVKGDRREFQADSGPHRCADGKAGHAWAEG